jgi:predicted phage terminase large subunit-like protein
MPPRHGKTETTTVRYPVYHLDRNPESSVLVTGYNERFARRFGRKTRNLAIEYGLQLEDNAKAADEWHLKAGGQLLTRGVGSPPTGVGFNRIVIDDPIRRREDAESEVYREKVWDWYTDDLYSRLEPGGAIVLIMTLWHEDDIGARAVASEPNRWHVLKLPAISDDGRALWPERYPIDALERIRGVVTRDEGERSWQALYQQNPTPKEGNTFKVSMIDIVDAAPLGLPIIRAWDIAATIGAGDYTVGVKLTGSIDRGWFVLDVIRGQWDSSERDRLIGQTAQLDGRECTQIVPQDPGAAGKSQVEAMIRNLSGVPVRKVRPTGTKEMRADPLASQVNAGNVRIVSGEWNRSFIEELRQFPGGKHDDQVDAASDAFNEIPKKQRGSGPPNLSFQTV